jgi:uncharacterized protein YbdZ (MbtH family)
MRPNNALEDPRLAASAYVVNATSDEQHSLWREWSKDAIASGWGSARNERVDWEQDSSGWMRVVGELAGFPINIDLSWAIVDGVLVLFWDGISRVVDYQMCEDWLKEHVPAFAQRHTNATNFHHMFQYARAKRNAP